MNLPKDFFDKRPLSWSQVSSFEYSPEQWFESYVLGIKQKSKEMDYGALIDRKFQDDPTFFPEIPRGELLQHKMKVMFNGIPLVGVPDVLSVEKEKRLADLKTGKKKWDKARADDTGQLTMYLLLVYISKKIKPEEFRCFIHHLKTQDNGDFSVSLVPNCKPITIETSRNMSDLLKFGQRINQTVEAMREFAAIHS